jgi:ketosteroid isomerase-like protein
MDTDKHSADNDPTAAGHERWLQSIKEGDVASILSLFHPDAILMPQNETSLYGIDEIREWLEDYFKHFEITAYGDTEREVRITGSVAVERNAYMVAISPLRGGERIRDDGRFLTVWTSDGDGTWKISQTMMNSMRPVGSGTSRFMVRMMERQDEQAPEKEPSAQK